MKIVPFIFCLSFTLTSDHTVKNTNQSINKIGIKTNNVKKAAHSSEGITDRARQMEYQIIMEYINDARKSSGYEN